MKSQTATTAFKAKNVLITGATSGIGESLARQFATQGANLILVARSADKLTDIAAQLRQRFSVEVWVLTADLAEAGAARHIYAETTALGIAVDILVNNAGVGRFGEFTKTDYSVYASMLQLNISALAELCWLYLPGMRQRDAGGIINIASNIALVPGPYMAMYSASKSFVLKLSESLAGEVLGSGVTVTCVCPGRTKTGFGEGAGAGKDFYDDKPHDTPEQVAAATVDAFQRRQVFTVTGPQQWLMTQLPRLLSRQRIIAMMAGVSRKLYS